MDYKVRHKRILKLLSLAQKIHRKAAEYRTPAEKWKATQLNIKILMRVTELVSESVEQNTKFIEDSKRYHNTNLKRVALNLPASIKGTNTWTVVADDFQPMLDK